MRRAVYLAVGLIVVTAAPGCAVIPIPFPRSVPGGINAIQVVDAETGRAIPDAQVAATVGPWFNWFKGTGARLSLEPTDKAEPSAVEEKQEKFQRVGKLMDAIQGLGPLDLKRQPDGTFVVEDRLLIAAIRPIGIPGPLGWALYDDYCTSITVRAPGYLGVSLSCDPNTDLQPGWSAAEPGVGAEFVEGGVLRFRLQRRAESPAGKQK